MRTAPATGFEQASSAGSPTDLPTELAAAPASLREPRPSGEVTIIKPSSGWRAVNLRELWAYRELIYFLAWRDIKVRYRQTLLGVAWVLIQPLLTMLIFTVFLGQLAKVPSDGLPYAVFAYAGLVAWTYFANAATNSGGSLVMNEKLVSRVYFPRLIVPIAGVIAGLVDFAIGIVTLIPLLLWFKMVPARHLVFAPIFVLLALITALAVGVWLSALDVQYRDVRYAIPFLIQAWMFATPVVYPASLVPSQFRPLYGLNPMSGVVEGFRWALLARTGPPTELVLVSTGVALFILVTGLLYFRRMERTFADVI